jgi:hypothetical protein
LKTRNTSRFAEKKSSKNYGGKPSRFRDAPKTKNPRIKNYSKSEEDTTNLEKIVGKYSQSAQNDFGFIDVE